MTHEHPPSRRSGLFSLGQKAAGSLGGLFKFRPSLGHILTATLVGASATGGFMAGRAVEFAGDRPTPSPTPHVAVASPMPSPFVLPSSEPSVLPSIEPSAEPTLVPGPTFTVAQPTASPTPEPTAAPTPAPTPQPSVRPHDCRHNPGCHKKEH